MATKQQWCALPQFWRLLLLFSRVQLFVTPWTAARQVSLSFTISQSLLKLMSIESIMSFNHLILSLPSHLPSISSSIRVFFKLGSCNQGFGRTILLLKALEKNKSFFFCLPPFPLSLPPSLFVSLSLSAPLSLSFHCGETNKQKSNKHNLKSTLWTKF